MAWDISERLVDISAVSIDFWRKSYTPELRFMLLLSVAKKYTAESSYRWLSYSFSIEGHWHLWLGLKTTCVSDFAYYNLSATINMTKIDQISGRTNAEINCVLLTSAHL